MLKDHGLEYRIIEHNLPMSVRGFVKKKNDLYCIVINSSLSDDLKMKTLRHEFLHIINGDLDKDCPVDLIEEGMI